MTSSPPSTLHDPLLAWHGFRLRLLPEWSPVKIDGDWLQGSIQIADLHAPRLAMRWETVKRPKQFDAQAWARKAIEREGGKDVASRELRPSDAWSAGLLVSLADRTVWVGHHAPSHRLLEIVCPVPRVLADEIVPTLRAGTREASRFWSIFDLSCTVPAGWALRTQRLNAGDLTLTFGAGRQTLIVRQVGPATLAIARQPIEQWLEQQARVWRKFYRATAEDSGSPLSEGEGPAFVRSLALVRRRRFFYLRHLDPGRSIVSQHDADRDRLVFIDAPTRDLAVQTLATVGQIGDD